LDDFPISFRFIEGIAVVTVEGKLDDSLVGLAFAAVDELVAQERYRIILDFQGLGVVSSSALGVFMAYVEDLRERQAYEETAPEIKLVVGDPRIHNMSGLLGFDLLFDLYESVYEAVEAFLGEEEG
jgi:anti-anti-sigma factor